MTAKIRPTLVLLRDAVAVAAVAVLTVQGLRRWYGDRYLVPSDSMQPVLYGDPERGDVVFVDKTASAAARVRGDLVVVSNPSMPGHQLVKRIAACGDEKGKTWINIRHGDVWLGDNRQQLFREQKEPRAAMARSVPWAVAGGSVEQSEPLDLRAASRDGGGSWLLPPAAGNLADARAKLRKRAHVLRHRTPEDGVLPRGMIGTNRPVDAAFLDLDQRRCISGEGLAVVDCGMQMHFDKLPAVVLATIDTAEFATTFVWNARDGSLAVWVDGKTTTEKSLVLRRPWQGGLTYGRLDGRDFLLLDDDVEFVAPTPEKGQLKRPRTWLHCGVVGDQPVGLQSLRVFRDVFAYRQQEASVGENRMWPKHVPAGHWFLLGDNAFDSRDSRQFGAVATTHFMGVPTRVIGPWSRARVLTP